MLAELIKILVVVVQNDRTAIPASKCQTTVTVVAMFASIFINSASRKTALVK